MGTWAAGPDCQPNIQSPLPAMHIALGQQRFSKEDTVCAGLACMAQSWWQGLMNWNSRKSTHAETSLTVMGR